MRNYCGKCGARIDPQTGLCPRCEMPKPRRRRGKYLWIPAAALLVIAAAVALLWTQGWLPWQGQAAEDETAPPEQEIAAPVTEPLEQAEEAPAAAADEPALVVLSAPALEAPVFDAATAEQVLAQAGPDLGYENALSSLTGAAGGTAAGLHTYRLQQRYGEVPVYGRAASLIVDAAGDALLLTGNFADVDPAEIVNRADLTLEQAVMAAAEQLAGQSTQMEASSAYQALYAAADGWRYVCVLPALLSGGEAPACDVLVDLETGDVLTEIATVSNVAAGSGVPEPDMTAYSILESANLLYAAEGDYYVGVTLFSGRYLLEDSQRGISIHNCNGRDSRADSTLPAYIAAENGNEYDSNAVELLHSVSLCYDFFDTYFGDTGYSHLSACYNDGYDDGGNALGGRTVAQSGYISLGYRLDTDSIAALAHEYTHVITSRANWNGGAETDAVSEGLSDLFACLIRAYAEALEEDPYITKPSLSGLDVQWSIAYPEIGMGRNLQDPAQTGNPARLEEGETVTEGHQSSTIVSHAAYLMWNGIDGDAAARLDPADLGAVWYLAMQAMPSDVNLAECRTLVEAAAALLTSRDKLTDEQLQCVSDAFDRVGISGSFDAADCAADLKAEWERTQQASDPLPADLPAQFTFASGAGGWWTELTLQPDGSFTGQFSDWNLGGVMPEMEAEAGEPLPNGQCYRCDFTGTFGSIRKVSDVEYALVLTDLTCAQEPGTHAVIDGAWIDYTEPYGLEGGEEFRLYLPGRSTADFSESLQSWLKMPAALDEMPDPLDRWCLYNVATDSGFYSAPVEAGPAQPQSAAEIWEVFVENRDYDVYLNDWNLEVAAPTGYALADLNGDGWEELVLYGEQNFDPGFANHSVFVCDRETLTVTLLPIATAFASEGGYDTVGQSYGGIRYDPAYHALVYTEMRNGSRFGYYSFWTLEAGKVSASQSLHFEQDEGGTYHYTWHDGGTAQEITQEEFSSRLGDNNLTFTPLPEA